MSITKHPKTVNALPITSNEKLNTAST